MRFSDILTIACESGDGFRYDHIDLPTALNTENVKYSRVKNDLYEIGIITVKSPGGNPIRIYSAERTLCDILKGRNNIDIQIVTDAFKRYTRLDRKNIPLLSEYAKLFKVEKKLRAYLEVLL